MSHSPLGAAREEWHGQEEKQNEEKRNGCAASLSLVEPFGGSNKDMSLPINMSMQVKCAHRWMLFDFNYLNA
jgi:hypothetical protein